MQSTGPILLTEDDADDALITQLALKRAGIENKVVLAESGEALIDLITREALFLSTQRPCLILLDLSLPGITGQEVLEWLKLHPPLSEVPVAIVSASERMEDFEACRRLGACDYLVKPLSFFELARMLKAVYERQVAPPPPEPEPARELHSVAG